MELGEQNSQYPTREQDKLSGNGHRDALNMEPPMTLADVIRKSTKGNTVIIFSPFCW